MERWMGGREGQRVVAVTRGAERQPHIGARGERRRGLLDRAEDAGAQLRAVGLSVYVAEDGYV
jgi:hypothetical protein